jgi:hypothetical protein
LVQGEGFEAGPSNKIGARHDAQLLVQELQFNRRPLVGQRRNRTR